MKLLVTGVSGFIGSHIAAALASSFQITGTYMSRFPTRQGAWLGGHRIELIKTDVTDNESIVKLFDSARPDAVIHAAALASVAACEADAQAAKRINVEGSANVATAAKNSGAYLIYLSTDMVFRGNDAPYTEQSEPCPLSIYGETKAEGEKHMPSDALILRLSLGYGKSLDEARPNFFEDALAKLAKGTPVNFFHDEWRTPLWVGDTVKLMPLLLDSKPRGVLHVGGPERMSRVEMAMRACKALRVPTLAIKSVSRADMPGPPRPKDVSFDSSRLRALFSGFQFTALEESLILSQFNPMQ